ncbi:hypothetical protein BDR07DRAFT_256078 [Suillus spraguei]|nr:hypothetical protein BDR07DRAFT_256078 [Suillus spraguei]
MASAKSVLGFLLWALSKRSVLSHRGTPTLIITTIQRTRPLGATESTTSHQYMSSYFSSMVQAWSSSIVPLFLMNRSKTLTDLLTIRRKLEPPSPIATISLHSCQLYHTIPTVLRGPGEYTDVSQVTRCEINAKSRVTVPNVGVRFNVRDGLQRWSLDGCTLSPFSSAGMVNSCFALRHPTTSHARELIS